MQDNARPMNTVVTLPRALRLWRVQSDHPLAARRARRHGVRQLRTKLRRVETELLSTPLAACCGDSTSQALQC